MKRAIWILGILILLVIQPVLGGTATIGLDQPTNSTIYVYGAGKYANISDINASVNNATLLNQTSPGIWLLNASIVLNGTNTNFYINSTDTTWLRINSTYSTVFNITRTVNNANLIINDTKITSWNTSKNDTEVLVKSVAGFSTPRSYITSGIVTGTYIIKNSNISYLGYNSFGAYGIYFNNLRATSVFEFTNNTVIENMWGIQLRGGQYNIIQNNTFEGNYYGGIYIGDSTKSSLFDNNTISNSSYITQSLSSYGIYVTHTDFSNENNKIWNNSIINNNIINVKYGIATNKDTNSTGSIVLDNNISSNNITTVDTGILIESLGYNRTNLGLSRNVISNVTRHDDNYGIGIMIIADNVTADNNTIKAGSVGICICQAGGFVNDIVLRDNNIDLYNLSYSDMFDVNDIPSGIRISPDLKSYVKSGYSGAPNWTNYLSTKIARNIVLNKNSFGNNVSLLLHIDSANNVTHDLQNYWLLNYSFPELFSYTAEYINNTNKNTYLNGNYVNRSYVSGLSYTNPNHKYIDNRGQKRYVESPSTFVNVYFGYIINITGFHLQSQGIKYNLDTFTTTNLTNNSNIPYNITIYYPLYSIFYGVPSKNVTVFSNGTSQIQLLNDTLEPNWYDILSNATMIPSSDNITVNISVWNTTGNFYKKWNETSSVSTVATNHTIGDFPPNTAFLIKKNGSNWNTYISNATGYIFFNYTEGYSDIQFEAINSSCNWCKLVNVTVFANGSAKGYNPIGSAEGNLTMLFSQNASNDQYTYNLTQDNSTHREFNESSNNASLGIQVIHSNLTASSNFSVRVFWNNGTLLNSSAPEVITGYTTGDYVKVTSLNLSTRNNGTRNLSITWQGKNNGGMNQVPTKIYKNGIPIGTEIIFATNVYSQVWDNFTNLSLNTSDTVELWALIGFGVQGFTKDFQIYDVSAEQKFQDFYVYSNSTGFLTYNSTGFEYPRYTIISQETPSNPYVVVIITVTVIIGGVVYYLIRIKKV